MAEQQFFIKSGVTPDYNVVFFKEGEKVGELGWGSGKMKFTGDMDKSAREFFDFLKPFVDGYIAEHKGGN